MNTASPQPDHWAAMFPQIRHFTHPVLSRLDELDKVRRLSVDFMEIHARWPSGIVSVILLYVTANSVIRSTHFFFMSLIHYLLYPKVVLHHHPYWKWDILCRSSQPPTDPSSSRPSVIISYICRCKVVGTQC